MTEYEIKAYIRMSADSEEEAKNKLRGAVTVLDISWVEELA